MADLIASIVATHHPNWADLRALLNILLTAYERELVINRANEGNQHLQQEGLDGTLNPAEAIPLTEPNWNPSSGGLAFLKHYKVYTGRA